MRHLGSYVRLKAGIQAVIVYCVNDAAVMQAWGKDQKVGLVRSSRTSSS